MRIYKTILFCLLLLPAVYLTLAVLQNDLGPDPAEALADATGEWTLRILLLALTITPLRKATGVVQLTRFRRMIGLFAFFYACVHLLVFVAFLLGWQWSDVYEALLERPYISVGFASFLLMLPLAATSTNSMRRKLGRRWNVLHRLIYPAAILALIHLFWQVRSDYTEALVYIFIFTALMLLRKVPGRIHQRRTTQ